MDEFFIDDDGMRLQAKLDRHEGLGHGSLGAQREQDVADAANRIAAWCGLRNVRELKPQMTDLFVLFGGGVVGMLDALVEAMELDVAARYAIVGGRGHATFGLERAMEQEFASWDDAVCPKPDVSAVSEAEMLSALLAQRTGRHVDLLETKSTNCGNNIGYLLDLLDGEPCAPSRVVLCQDATMQRRMDATWKRHVQERPRYANTAVVNWAAFKAQVAWRDGSLVYERAPRGMWDVEHFLRLLSGEVTRLTDDEHGYGPCGAGFIVHVDVPADIQEAHKVLRAFVGSERRS